MNNAKYDIVDSVAQLEKAIERVRKAQQIFSTFSQEQVDKIFLAAASAANKQRIPLAKLAVEELSLIHISEPTRLLSISYAVFCLKKKKK